MSKVEFSQELYLGIEWVHIIGIVVIDLECVELVVFATKVDTE
jgi:hypothetical protein